MRDGRLFVLVLLLLRGDLLKLNSATRLATTASDLLTQIGTKIVVCEWNLAASRNELSRCEL
jgi:hypothetical protein